ncbi:hypothetical protein FOA52_004916 [Chlamydomonas sp. UWO 241]|nr:hypothetical protein FOA52_004916 [Chlamydomonas sp. UWO 241]
MGGHGGLNILPQKSWHVYNRDNQSKVEKDEAEAAEEEEAVASHAADAEREYRWQVLQQRTCPPGGQGEASTSGAASHGVEALRAAAVAEPADAPAANGHVNFWSEDELRMKAQHPEVEAEKREATKKRGNAATYTTNSKFDESFAVGYQMGGERPWYAQKPASEAAAVQQPVQPAVASTSGAAPPTLDAAAARPRQELLKAAEKLLVDAGGLDAVQELLQQVGGRRPSGGGGGGGGSSSSDSSSSSSNSGSSSDSSGSSDRHRKRRRRSSSGKHSKQRSQSRGKETGKHSKRGKASRKSKQRRGERERGKVEVGGGGKSLQQLRDERMEREQQERARERALLMGLAPAAEPKGYSQTFGHAASLKRRRDG